MRPKLDITIEPDEFLNYYWLKKELQDFCKIQSIPRSGSKQELTERISHYLKTGKILQKIIQKSAKRSDPLANLTLESIIPDNYKNNERHRAFFKNVIGEHFKFNVPFMNWMKKNSGKTYQDAVDKWNLIYKEKKSGKKFEISSQFKYNQYIRDFFQANPNMTKKEAITCWKYKKSIPGSNKYEEKDLEILK